MLNKPTNWTDFDNTNFPCSMNLETANLRSLPDPEEACENVENNDVLLKAMTNGTTPVDVRRIPIVPKEPERSNLGPTYTETNEYMPMRHLETVIVVNATTALPIRFADGMITRYPTLQLKSPFSDIFPYQFPMQQLVSAVTNALNRLDHKADHACVGLSRSSLPTELEAEIRDGIPATIEKNVYMSYSVRCHNVDNLLAVQNQMRNFGEVFSRDISMIAGLPLVFTSEIRQIPRTCLSDIRFAEKSSGHRVLEEFPPSAYAPSCRAHCVQSLNSQCICQRDNECLIGTCKNGYCGSVSFNYEDVNGSIWDAHLSVSMVLIGTILAVTMQLF